MLGYDLILIAEIRMPTAAADVS